MMDAFNLETGSGNTDYTEYREIYPSELFLKAVADDYYDREDEDRDVDAKLSVSDYF
jgi:hypothetical protein